jgi:hypothetical protein
MASQTSTSHSGVFGFFEDHWKLLLGLVIVALVIVAILAISNSSLWELLKSLFGAGNAIASLAADQLNKCFSSFVNFINPASGCFLGIFAIGFGLLWVGARIYGAVRGSGNVLAEQAKFLTGKSDYQLAQEAIQRDRAVSDSTIRDAFKTQGVSDPTADQMSAARLKIANNGVAQEAEAANIKSGSDPTEKARATTNLAQSNQAANRSIDARRGFSPENAHVTDEVARDVKPPVEVK